MDVDRLPELSELGWKPDRSQQVMTYAEHLEPARVIESHRSGLVVAPSLANQHEFALGGRWFNLPPDERPVVGDWLLIDPQTESIEVLLDRSNLIKRLAPSGEIQPIAANIDTAFVVTSCNADFSLRIDETEYREDFETVNRGIGFYLSKLITLYVQVEVDGDRGYV